MPSFDTRTAAVALGMTPKFLSNLLTRMNLPELAGIQGTSRRLPEATVRFIGLVSQLSGIGLPAKRAAELALACLAGTKAIPLSPGLTLLFDADRHAADIGGRLRAASEAVVVRKRGRPPGSGQ